MFMLLLPFFFFSYPSGTEKLALAKEIVSLFPSLKIQVPFGENEGHVRMFLHYSFRSMKLFGSAYTNCKSILESNFLFLHFSCQEHFFDGPSHNGFIEMRLRNIRRKLQQSQRTYNLKRRLSTEQPSLPITDETVPSEWLTLIKRMRPSPENSSSIKTAIDQTFSYRRRWITTKSPTVGEIFKEYPRFLDMPALVIHVKLSCRKLYTNVVFHNLLILIISLFLFHGFTAGGH